MVFWVQVFCLLRCCIPRYFILFDAVVNEIVSLVSLPDLTSHVYRNTRDFCVLILYPAISPNSLISSNSFLVASLEFSVYKYHVICKQWQFYFSFSNLDFFCPLILKLHPRPGAHSPCLFMMGTNTGQVLDVFPILKLVKCLQLEDTWLSI